MKLSKKGQFVLYNVLASFGISLSISFFMTLISNGFADGFVQTWGQSFILGYIIAVPSSMIVVPVVNRIMNRFISEI